MQPQGGKAGVHVRLLEQLPDLQAIDMLFASVWGAKLPMLGVELLRAIGHAGGYVSGAYLQGQLVGASAGFLGRHHGQLALHSHVTGVIPSARGAHVGRALKLHQRDWARHQGIGLVTWTFDPLVRRNAWFNIGRLGAMPVEYLVDFYGAMPDAINTGDESDRILAAWDVTVPLPIPQSPDEVETDGHRLIMTPEDIEQLRGNDPVSARRWRLRVRDELMGPVTAGQVVGFTRGGAYLVRG
jgi:predicted GNAT superfamily acetyltransferase